MRDAPTIAKVGNMGFWVGKVNREGIKTSQDFKVATLIVIKEAHNTLITVTS